MDALLYELLSLKGSLNPKGLNGITLILFFSVLQNRILKKCPFEHDKDPPL